MPSRGAIRKSSRTRTRARGSARGADSEQVCSRHKPPTFLLRCRHSQSNLDYRFEQGARYAPAGGAAAGLDLVLRRISVRRAADCFRRGLEQRRQIHALLAWPRSHGTRQLDSVYSGLCGKPDSAPSPPRLPGSGQTADGHSRSDELNCCLLQSSAPSAKKSDSLVAASPSLHTHTPCRPRPSRCRRLLSELSAALPACCIANLPASPCLPPSAIQHSAS